MAYSNKIGKIGERIVFNLLVSKGYDVRMSDDPYDESGDIYLSFEGIEYPIEVKTQMPKIYGRGRQNEYAETFTFHTNVAGVAKLSQEAKSKSATVMFVQIPYVNRGATAVVWRKPEAAQWIEGYNKYHNSATYEIPIKECEFFGQIESTDLIAARDTNPKYNPYGGSYKANFVESPSYEVTP
jgi:hypothetical protein